MKIIRIAEFAAAALLLLAGSARAEDHKLTIKDFMFMPMALTIAPGDTVTWVNDDGEPHTVVSLDGAFRSQALDEKDRFTHAFSQAGTFRYLCSIHPKMVGTITVKAP
jgi:plastocyanin